MLRDEIESLETTSPTLLGEQTEQLKRIPQVFSDGELILIQPKAKLNNVLGR